MSTVPASPDSAAAKRLDPDRFFTLQDAINTYALASQPTHLGNQVRDALDVIERALDQYNLRQLALSFNGGKDCTVLIHLLAAAVLLRHNRTLAESVSDQTRNKTAEPPSLPSLLAVYVRCQSPFPQVETFVSLCTRWYHLELDAVEGGMKEALQEYLDLRKARRASSPGPRTRRIPAARAEADTIYANGSNGEARPANGTARQNGKDAVPPGDEIRAIMVGTRRTDPHGATLTPFVPTDPSWPSFMRVHPILDWSYKDVWDFLRCPELTLGAQLGELRPVLADATSGRGRATRLEWCELYDDGYTSLGSTYNTFPNPLLRVSSGTAVSPNGHGPHQESLPPSGGGWRPAWELKDGNAERAGRESHLALSSESLALDQTEPDAEFPIGSAPNSRAPSPELAEYESIETFDPVEPFLKKTRAFRFEA